MTRNLRKILFSLVITGAFAVAVMAQSNDERKNSPPKEKPPQVSPKEKDRPKDETPKNSNPEKGAKPKKPDNFD